MPEHVSADEAARWLSDHHGVEVSSVEPLSGGYWSSAFGYRIEDRELVLRVGEVVEGFEADRRAHEWSRPGMPVPEVHEIGQAFDLHFAISARHHGRFLEDVGVDEAAVAGPTLQSLLAALRSVQGRSEKSWAEWLRLGLTDDPSSRTGGWRDRIAADHELEARFTRSEALVLDALGHLPERTDLVHSDLLHGNVLLDERGRTVTAVFSWKCSTFGDCLYDVAWCTFWGRWHDGIGAIDTFGDAMRAPDLSPEDLEDAAMRHHVYEVHIGTSHMAWYAFNDDRDNQEWLGRQLDEVLDRGPLDA